MKPLAHAIVRRLHELDSERLDAALATLGLPTLLMLQSELEFTSWDTGGGCMMLLSNLTTDGDYRIGITNGSEGLPEDSETFWFGILKEDNSEIYSTFVTNGAISGR